MLNISLRIPVWQSPMAGVTTPELVAAASEAGVFGNIGAGYLSGEQTRTFIQEVKALTSKPFGINLFVPEPAVPTNEQLEAASRLLNPYRKELGLNEKLFAKEAVSSTFHEQLQVVLEEKVAVCSFTFGLPDQEVIQKLKANGTKVIGTATTVKEAQEVEACGMDGVVVQGSEAGGHRGTFQEEEHLIGLISLLPQVVQAVQIPVIAAGGLMNGQGIAAALCLGADVVQMGTAFLTAEESGAHPLHKEAILSASEEDTRVTKVFSGKSARGIVNRFMNEMAESEQELPPYPIQNSFTSEIRKKAGELNNRDFLSMWSGQSPRLSRRLTVAQLIEKLEKEWENALKAGQDKRRTFTKNK
ncbi:nitronate monooxygenase [Bacillus ectoiniformans]|uniref:NAD(P)H-dependent flavin oxidoreductase n=1 Tax=Bacillus ectoiniformans TaxID=1494429 RepID=UPI00195A2DFE|nr:nitronate monooxygenase [Bacillus ectoiniformans]MBM7649419.1 nitronate monooxygenase [Bacillus ectoiniformans]